MTNPVTEHELQALVDGELPKERLRAVLVHLGTHPDEIPRIAWYIVQKDELHRRLQAIEVDDDPTTRCLERELAERLERRSPRPWLRRSAAVVLLLGAGWWSHSLSQELFERQLPSVVTEAAQAHQVFAGDRQRPVELVAAAEPAMVAWFSRHLGEPVEIPSLEALGLRLVGGRLLPGEDQPIAQLIYEDRAGRRLTVALSHEPEELGEELHTAEVEGLAAGYWQIGDLTYAVVAATSEAQLVAIAEELGADQPERFL